MTDTTTHVAGPLTNGQASILRDARPISAKLAKAHGELLQIFAAETLCPHRGSYDKTCVICVFLADLRDMGTVIQRFNENYDRALLGEEIEVTQSE